jgi:hypothetical protein
VNSGRPASGAQALWLAAEPVADADFGQNKVRLVRYCAERPE